jgi:ferric-dicitrate binding protein FerR (iron transport regulator)
MSENERYIDLIFRYLSHEADESEISLLAEWTKSDSKNQKLLDNYRKTFDLTSNYLQREVSEIEIEREWNLISTRINFSSFNDYGNKTTKRKTYLLYAAAAVLAIVLLIGGGLLYTNRTTSVTLTSENKVLQTNLSDGTQISLNTGSRLEYNSDFNIKSRKIRLHGNAYFEVSHNPEKPFIVETDGISIQDLGTKFVVEQSDSGVFVAVTEGKVKVYNTENPEKGIILQSGENTLFNSKKVVQKKQTGNNPNIISWSNGKLTFDNTPLQAVISDVERTYHVKIVLKNPELKNCLLTVSFNNESIESVLKIVETALNLQIKHSGNTIEIDGKKCN